MMAIGFLKELGQAAGWVFLFIYILPLILSYLSILFYVYFKSNQLLI